MRNSNLNGKQCSVDSNLDLKSYSVNILSILIHILYFSYKCSSNLLSTECLFFFSFWQQHFLQYG